MVRAVANPIGKRLNEGFKVGDAAHGGRNTEAQLAAVSVPLRADVRTVPTRVGVQTETCGGVWRIGPHGCDVDLPAAEGAVVGNGEHAGARRVDALCLPLRGVVG